MRGIIKKDHIWGGLVIASFLSVILALSSLGCIPQILDAKRSAWEQRARATLRSYGESELAYQNANLDAKRSAWEKRAIATLRSYGESELAYQNANFDHHWSTWQALKDTDYIADGYSRGKFIENYSIWTSVYIPSDLGSSDYPFCTFTIVAFPRRTSPPGYTSTFAIREDQTLRVYRSDTPGVNAWGENGDYGTLTWEPIR